MYPPERVAEPAGALAGRPGLATAAQHLRRQWRLLLLAYAASVAVGTAFAVMVQRAGDWHYGLGWERALMLRINGVALAQPVDWLLLAVPWLGTNLTLFPIALVACGWLAWRGRWDVAVWLMTTELGCLSMNWLIKRFSARERPALWERVGWFGWGSYPSGHAMVSLAMLFTVAIILDRERGWRWPYWAAGALVALIVYSRLHHGVHWPTDMVGGLLVGGLWLAATKRAFAGSRPPVR